MREDLLFAPEVAEARATSRPVVALETAILTHGLPPPLNLETARAMEAAVRETGAVPATIGVLGDGIHIGLSPRQLETLASEPDRAKASVRDLAHLLARRRAAGTTVAATAYLARRAGIRFLATGGLGGVHRGGERSLDISADLGELRRSPLVVVCSGIKAVLDLSRTLEVLETLGVPIFGFGTDRLPGFYVCETPHRIPCLDDIEEAVAVITAQARLGWPASVLVAQPPPREQAFTAAEFEELLASALAEAHTRGVRGPEETPFLLRRIAEASGGRSALLNRELAVRNARLAGRLAVACRALSLKG